MHRRANHQAERHSGPEHKKRAAATKASTLRPYRNTKINMSNLSAPWAVQTKSPVAPEGASCWICLEEGPDEKGHPLMRNCACRGEASGFAHAPCIAQYLVVEEKRTKKFEITCKNCKQTYQGDMALAVAIARLNLCESEGIESSNERYYRFIWSAGF